MKLRFDRYSTGGGGESLRLHGPEDGVPLLIVPPLFEEANFTAAVIADAARRLGERGITCWIADLPGLGESLRPLETIRWEEWRKAMADAAAHVAARTGRTPHVASIRGGALVDDGATTASHWRLAPVTGAAIVRQMERAQKIGDGEAGRAALADEGAIELVGYRLAPALRDALREASPVDPAARLRVVPFENLGVAPWRRAEPAPDPALAAHIADDIAGWIACAA